MNLKRKVEEIKIGLRNKAMAGTIEIMTLTGMRIGNHTVMDQEEEATGKEARDTGVIMTKETPAMATRKGTHKALLMDVAMKAEIIVDRKITTGEMKDTAKVPLTAEATRDLVTREEAGSARQMTTKAALRRKMKITRDAAMNQVMVQATLEEKAGVHNRVTDPKILARGVMEEDLHTVEAMKGMAGVLLMEGTMKEGTEEAPRMEEVMKDLAEDLIIIERMKVMIEVLPDIEMKKDMEEDLHMAETMKGTDKADTKVILEEKGLAGRMKVDRTGKDMAVKVEAIKGVKTGEIGGMSNE